MAEASENGQQNGRAYWSSCHAGIDGGHAAYNDHSGVETGKHLTNQQAKCGTHKEQRDDKPASPSGRHGDGNRQNFKQKYGHQKLPSEGLSDQFVNLMMSEISSEWDIE